MQQESPLARAEPTRPRGGGGRPPLTRAARLAARLEPHAGGIWLLAVGTPVLLFGGLTPGATALGLVAAALGLGFELLGATLAGARIRVPPLALLAGLAASVSLLQCLPLPGALLALASPPAHGVRELAASLAGAAASRPGGVSVAPGDTAVFAAQAAQLGALAWAASLHLRRRGRDRRLVPMLVVLAALLLAVIAAHALFGTNSVYGLRPAAGRGFSLILGPLANSNHLGALLSLLAIPLLARGFSSDRLIDRLIPAALGGLCALCVFLTLSRGAAVGLLFGLLTLAGLLGFGRSRRFRPGIVLLPLLGLPAAFLVADSLSHGQLGLVLAPGQMTQLGARETLWWSALRLLGASPWLGIGHGSFVDLEPAFRQSGSPLAFRYVENAPLQALTDLGAPAFLLGLGLLARVARDLLGHLSSGRASSAELGLVAALAGLLLHDMVGFSLFVPGVAAVALVAATAAQGSGAAWGPVLRPRAAAVAALCVLAAAALALGLGQRAGYRRTHAELERLVATRPFGTAAEMAAVRVAATHPSDGWGWLDIGMAAASRDGNAALRFAGLAMILLPREWRPHRAAAEILEGMGFHGQSLIERKLALDLAGQEFPSVAAATLAAVPDPADRCRIAPPDGPPRRDWTLLLSGAPCQLALLDELMAASPNDLATAAARARLLSEAGHWDRAAAARADVQRIPGGAGTAALLEGEELARRGDPDAAASAYRRQLADPASPGRAQALAQLGLLLLSSGDLDGLDSLLDAERERGRGSDEFQAQLLYLEGRLLEARGASGGGALYRRALDLDPDSASFRDAVERTRERD